MQKRWPRWPRGSSGVTWYTGLMTLNNAMPAPLGRAHIFGCWGTNNRRILFQSGFSGIRIRILLFAGTFAPKKHSAFVTRSSRFWADSKLEAAAPSCLVWHTDKHDIICGIIWMQLKCQIHRNPLTTKSNGEQNSAKILPCCTHSHVTCLVIVATRPRT